MITAKHICLRRPVQSCLNKQKENSSDPYPLGTKESLSVEAVQGNVVIKKTIIYFPRITVFAVCKEDNMRNSYTTEYN